MKRHMETSARVAAEPHKVFAHLDDQTRLTEHMSKPSLMMGGGKISTNRKGRPSVRMAGDAVRAFGRLAAPACDPADDARDSASDA